MADTTEHHIALREAHQIAASDSFFAARKELRDTEHERYIFDAGFRRGFDAHESLQRKPTPTPPADAALADELDSVASELATYQSDNAATVSRAAAALRARAVPEELPLFDAAIAVELPCVSVVPYNSKEICTWFAKNVRERMLAASKSGDGGAG